MGSLLGRRDGGETLMRIVTSVAQSCFAVAIIAFGIQQVIYGEFVTRAIPKLPAWVPGHAPLAYITGIILIIAGASILTRKYAGEAAIFLGCLLLASLVFLYIPALLASPLLGGAWTNAGKALALCGGALLIATYFGKIPSNSIFPSVFLSAFLIVAGIQHFMFSSFVATLVPTWIPGHVFWTYFAGVALIAGGTGILIPKFTRLAGALTGIMIFLWVPMLHIPRALAQPHNSNETTAVFEALAFSATAFLAVGRTERSVRTTSS
jgi:uncharacterized membrane protein